MKDSSRKNKSLFSEEGLTQKGLLSVTVIGLCQAWSLSHIRHTNAANQEPITQNKRGPHSLRIPTRGYILQQGKSGMLGESAGDRLRATLPLPEGLISSVCVFSLSLFTIFIFQSISTSHSSTRPPHPSLWNWVWSWNIYTIVELTEEHADVRTGIPVNDKCSLAHCCSQARYLPERECVCVLRALDHSLSSRKGRS